MAVVFPEQRVLALRRRDPSTVIGAFPKVQIVDGQQFGVSGPIVGVPHRNDSIQILRNLGVDTTGLEPIRSYYEYPPLRGEFAPMEHQETTAEFFTVNKRLFCLNEQRCVDADTEYLSPNGWRRIADYSGGDVAQYDPINGEATFVTPQEFVKFPSRGFYHFKNHKGVDQQVSAGHRMLFVRDDPAHSLGAAHEAGRQGRRRSPDYKRSERGWYRDVTPETIHAELVSGKSNITRINHIPCAFNLKGQTGIELTLEQIRVCVMVFADGSFPEDNNICVVRVLKKSKTKRCVKLLKAARIDFSLSVVNDYCVFRFKSPLRAKHFPQEWYSATSDQLETVVNEVQYWDANLAAQERNPSRGVAYYTDSRSDADFVNFASSATGYRSWVKSNHRTFRGGRPCDVTEYTTVIQRHRKGTANLHGSTSSFVPASDGFQYCFRVPTSYLVFRRNGCVFLSGNTGKTSAAIWASDFLMSEKDVKAVLIICTMSCLRTVWENEVFNIVPGRSVAILHGTIERRRKLLAQNYNYFVINHDGIKILLPEILAAIKFGRIDLVILDEMAEFSDSKTDKYEAMEAIAYAAPRFWGLSATPMSKGPAAVWAQARLVNKNNVPRFFTHWRLDVETQVTKYKWVPKQDAKEKVYAALQPAIRFKKRDVLKNLPPLTHTRLEAELTVEQTKMIRELRKQGAMLLGSTRLTVANAAVMVNKALQICAGTVKLDDGTAHRLDCRPRLAELVSVINGTDQKFVVLANHHAEVDLLQEVLSPKYNTTWVDGRRTGTAREKAFLEFMNNPKCRGLIAHPKTVSHGLEFSVADTLIWWSPCHSAELVAQANERMASAAQKHPMGVYQLGGHRVEWNVYASSGNKLAYQASTLEQFKSFVND